MQEWRMRIVGRRWIGIFGVLMISLLLLSGPVEGGYRLKVVASITPLGSFCRELGGDDVEVWVGTPPGASPHVFEPSPRLVKRAMAADLFVLVGAGLDPWAERVVRSARLRWPHVLRITDGFKLIREISSHHEGEAEHGRIHHRHNHDEAMGNPHVWLDPVFVMDICRRIADAFKRLQPKREEAYEKRLHLYLKRLDALHKEIERRVSAFSIRKFISFHPSFTYFARRYGLVEVGVIVAFPGREPGPKLLQGLVDIIRKEGLRAIFTEPQLNPRAAEVIAREAGVKVLLLDPIGGRPPYGDDYIKLMRYNLKVMEGAMGPLKD